MKRLDKIIATIRAQSYEGEYESEEELIATAKEWIEEEDWEREQQKQEWFAEQPWLLEDSPSLRDDLHLLNCI